MTQNTSLNDKVRYVANRFAARNIKVCRDWLSGCIEFFCSEDPRISNDGLYANAHEQWLLADLSEIGEGCLPATVQSRKDEFVLDHMYPVQFQWLIDISESSYDQLRNLYDKKLDEAVESNEFNTTAPARNDTTKKNRVLRLEVTDGKITTHALEYGPIPCLTTKLTPGCKILLKGPLRCVNHILFIEPKNVEILGGEVDTLLIENAFENVLLKQLGKPINPNPKLEYKEARVVESKNPPATVPLAQRTPFVGQRVPNETKLVVPDTHATVIMEDDDFLLDINLDEIESRAVFMRQPPAAPVMNTPTKPRPHAAFVIEEDEQFLDDLDVLNEIENQIQNEQSTMNPVTKVVATPVSQPPPKRQKILDDFVDHSNFFDATMDYDVSAEIASHIVPPTKRVPTVLDDDYEFKVDGTNLATITELLKYQHDQLDGKKFVIACEIDSVAEKLQIKNNEYRLGVFLKDDTGQQIQARFHTDVLSKLADYTPQELQLMRQAEKERPHFKNQINEILSKLKTVLQEINCFMKIAYVTDGRTDFPVIIELISTNDTNTNTLNRKRSNE